MCADAELNPIRVHGVGVEGDVAISVRDVNKETLGDTDPRAAAEHEEEAPLFALQITAELFDAKATIESTEESIKDLADYVRPLLPPSKRHVTAPGD